MPDPLLVLGYTLTLIAAWASIGMQFLEQISE